MRNEANDRIWGIRRCDGLPPTGPVLLLTILIMAAALTVSGPDASGRTVRATQEARSDESSRSSERATQESGDASNSYKRETEDAPRKGFDDPARFASVSAGDSHSCGVRADGSAA